MPAPGSASVPTRAPPALSHPIGVCSALLFTVYPLFHLLVRLAVSEGLEYDEAEQVVLTQSLALGYPTVAGQPPLYTWLQRGFFTLLGMNVLALTGLRAVLQFLTQVALYRSALLILGHRSLAVLVALSLWLIPQFSVESMRKTHSVLATCLAAALLHALLVVWKSGSRGSYLWLGTVLGLGVLAKYNFAIVAAALLLACLLVEPIRQRLLDRRLGLGLAVAALLVAPHFIWLLHHLSAVTVQIGTRMDVYTAREWTIRHAARSFWSFAKNPIEYLPPVLLHLAVFGRPRETVSEAAAVVAQLIERFWLIAFGALSIAVLIISMARFHAHWLQPFLVLIPLYMFLRRPSANPSPQQLTIFAVALAIGIVLTMSWRLVEIWEGHRFRAHSRLNTPYPDLARQIGETGFHDGVLIVDHHMVGGNLRFVLQDATVVTTRMAEAGTPIPARPCLIVWDARKQAKVPQRLAPWVAANAEPTPPIHYVEARGPRADRVFFRLGFIQFPTCRRATAP